MSNISTNPPKPEKTSKKAQKKEKTPRKQVIHQILSLFLIIASVSYSGFALYKIDQLQEDVSEHEEVISILNNLYDFFTISVEHHYEFMTFFLGFNYEVNEMVNQGLMNETEANITVSASLREFFAAKRMHHINIEAQFKAYDLNQNLSNLDAISPNIQDLFGDLFTYYWVSANYTEDSIYNGITGWSGTDDPWFYQYFGNEVLDLNLLVAIYNLPYPHTKQLMMDVFTQGNAPPLEISNNVVVFSQYMNREHYSLLAQANQQIQGFLFGNGLNTMAVIFINISAEGEKLKFISTIIAFLILGASIFSLVRAFTL